MPDSHLLLKALAWQVEASVELPARLKEEAGLDLTLRGPIMPPLWFTCYFHKHGFIFSPQATMNKAPAKLKFQRVHFLPEIPASCFPQLGTPGPEVLSREQHIHRVLGSI